MKRMITVLFAVLLMPLATPAQDLPLPIPPTWMQAANTGTESDKDSSGLGNFADMLRADMLKRFREANEEIQSNTPRKRPERPRPELGQAEWRNQEPDSVDKYLDSETISPKPSITDILSASGSEDPVENVLKDIPLERRIAYVDDLIERRRYEDAENEIERLLQQKLERDQKIDLLVKREKVLFHEGHHSLVEQDIYRLQAFFPEHEGIQELKTYIEEQSGIKPLQEAVLASPNDPVVQQQLVNQYMRYQWLDFAEEFFAFTIQDTSPATVKSLSEIYFKRRDFDLLIELSRKALDLHPNHPDILYNLGVGLYHRGDPLSRDDARETFLLARQHSRNPAVLHNIGWYLERLPISR